jgi:hypothetical protein
MPSKGQRGNARCASAAREPGRALIRPSSLDGASTGSPASDLRHLGPAGRVLGVNRTRVPPSLLRMPRQAMSFKILFLIALFAPLLLIAAGAILHGPKTNQNR